MLDKSSSDVNARDNAGWTPLHEVILEKPESLRVVALLIDRGADVNAAANNGNTPLHDAAAYVSLDMVKLLVEKGADCELANGDGKTPVDVAATEATRAFFRKATAAKDKAVSSPARPKTSTASPALRQSTREKRPSSKLSDSMQETNGAKKSKAEKVPNGGGEANKENEKEASNSQVRNAHSHTHKH